MKFEIDYDGRAAENMLHGVAERAGDDTVFDLLGKSLVEHEERAFATGGFGEWAPLSPATLAAKNGGRILVNTGRLEQVLTSPGGIRTEGDTVSTAPDKIAGFLRAGARGAPKRNPTPAPEQSAVRDWAQDVATYIAEGIQ